MPKTKKMSLSIPLSLLAVFLVASGCSSASAHEARAELTVEEGTTVDFATVEQVLSDVRSCAGPFSLVSLNQDQGKVVTTFRGCTRGCCLPKAEKALESLEGVKVVSLTP